MPSGNDLVIPRLRGPSGVPRWVDALSLFEPLVCKSEIVWLREVFESSKGDGPPGFGIDDYSYDAETDRVVGYFYLPADRMLSDWSVVERYEVDLGFTEFVALYVTKAANATVTKILDELRKCPTQQELRSRTRYYLKQSDRLRQSIDEEIEEEVAAVVNKGLEEVSEQIRLRSQPLLSNASTPDKPVGRPLTSEVDEEEIRRLVWDYARRPGFVHKSGKRKGQPKPTRIRDTLLEEHPDACDPLSDRALFDWVKRALAAGPPEE